jgi:hypothetical protein
MMDGMCPQPSRGFEPPSFCLVSEDADNLVKGVFVLNNAHWKRLSIESLAVEECVHNRWGIKGNHFTWPYYSLYKTTVNEYNP